MTWTDIDPYHAVQLVDAADMAALKADIEYRHQTNVSTYHHPGTGANYTVSGELGQDVDSTNFKLTLVSTGGLVAAMVYCQVLVPTSTSARLSIVRQDTIAYSGRNLFYDFDVQILPNATYGQSRGWIKPFPNLPAGTHEFRLAWGISPSGTATMFIGYRPRFTVFEWC